MDKLAAAEQLIYDINRSHLMLPAMVGRCPTKGCGNRVNGSGSCGDCLEGELADLVGRVAARTMHIAIKRKHYEHDKIRKILMDEL